MKNSRNLLAAILSAVASASAFADINIRAYPPGVAINGKVIPSEATFMPPLLQGEIMLLEVAGKEALRLEILEGEVHSFSTRVKMAEGSEITYRRMRDGALKEAAKIGVTIKDGEAPTGEATFIAKNSENLREKAIVGEYRMLAYTSNGFGTVLTLRDDGFHVRITGSNSLSNQFFIGVKGKFSERLKSTFEPMVSSASK